MSEPYYGMNTNQNPDGSIIVQNPPPVPPAEVDISQKRKRREGTKKGEAFKDVDLDALNEFCDDFMGQAQTLWEGQEEDQDETEGTFESQ